MTMLIHLVVGMTKQGDVDHHTRVQCINVFLPEYPADRTARSGYPLMMCMGGPRNAIRHSSARTARGQALLRRDAHGNAGVQVPPLPTLHNLVSEPYHATKDVHHLDKTQALLGQAPRIAGHASAAHAQNPDIQRFGPMRHR